MKTLFIYSICCLIGCFGATSAMAQPAAEMQASEASFQAIVEQLQHIYAADIIMGKPVEVNGLKLIPLATVGVGYGQRATSETEQQELHGTGGFLNPVGIIVLSGENVKLIQFSKGFLEQIVGALASVMMQMLKPAPQPQPDSPAGDETAGTVARPPAAQSFTVDGSLSSLYFKSAIFLGLGWLALVVIMTAFFPQQVTRVVSTLQINYWRAGLLGLVGYGVVWLLMAVFLFSMIGIPLALLVMALALLFTVFGSAGLALTFGQHLMTALKKPESSQMLCVLAGGVVLGLLTLVPILGWLVWAIIGLFGFGTTIQLQWQAVKR